MLLLSFFSVTFLSRRNDALKFIIGKRCPPSIPVIFMFDNINIYRGRARYVRLKHKLVPIQWNFTVRAALTPKLEGIESLFTNPETAQKPQKPVAKMDFKDLLIG
jgi:hypothetical protein